MAVPKLHSGLFVTMMMVALLVILLVEHVYFNTMPKIQQTKTALLAMADSDSLFNQKVKNRANAAVATWKTRFTKHFLISRFVLS